MAIEFDANTLFPTLELPLRKLQRMRTAYIKQDRLFLCSAFESFKLQIMYGLRMFNPEYTAHMRHGTSLEAFMGMEAIYIAVNERRKIRELWLDQAIQAAELYQLQYPKIPRSALSDEDLIQCYLAVNRNTYGPQSTVSQNHLLCAAPGTSVFARVWMDALHPSVSLTEYVRKQEKSRFRGFSDPYYWLIRRCWLRKAIQHRGLKAAVLNRINP